VLKSISETVKFYLWYLLETISLVPVPNILTSASHNLIKLSNISCTAPLPTGYRKRLSDLELGDISSPVQ